MISRLLAPGLTGLPVRPHVVGVVVPGVVVFHGDGAVTLQAGSEITCQADLPCPTLNSTVRSSSMVVISCLTYTRSLTSSMSIIALFGEE